MKICLLVSFEQCTPLFSEGKSPTSMNLANIFRGHCIHPQDSKKAKKQILLRRIFYPSPPASLELAMLKTIRFSSNFEQIALYICHEFNSSKFFRRDPSVSVAKLIMRSPFNLKVPGSSYGKTSKINQNLRFFKNSSVKYFQNTFF